MVLQMTKEQFMEEMAYVLDLDENGGVLSLEQSLDEIEEWDSLSYVAFLAMANKASGKRILPAQVKAAKTMRDLFVLAGGSEE